MDVDLRHLRAFCAVAEELHFGHAAERLHVSQPALSRQISNLEHRLGATLLARGTRKVLLTDAGSVLHREATSVLAQADRAVDRTRRVAQGEAGHLSIGLLGAAVDTLATSVLRAMRKAHPDVTFTLTERPWIDQTAGLESGADDFCFVRDLAPNSGWQTVDLLSEPLCVVLPSDHPLAGEEPLTHSQLALLESESFLSNRRWLAVHCANWPVTPRLTDELVSTHAILALVRAGFGVSFMPASYSAWGTGVSFVPVEGETSKQQLAYPVSSRSELHQHFLEAASSAVQDTLD